MASLFGIKVLKFHFFKLKQQLPLYNAYVTFSYSEKLLHWKFVLYAPLLLLTPILLMFLHPIFFYIGLYFISTVVVYKKKIIWICLPSKADIKYKYRMEYFDYLIKNTSKEQFDYFMKRNDLNTMVYNNHLMNEHEYFYSKQKQK